ncbi:GSCFA domain-containing protein [Hymenobacter sp. 102]|uniref:GSCFA domain-containing protein n=1 Tax=Hymenobacter sp. 102 TaxID=3403152 RepID=UPI003CEFEFCB
MFRTELPLTPLPQQLPPSARVLTIGSCFSDSIGTRLADFKVATMVNPFGTVFNPISLCRLLRAAAGEDMDWQQHVVEARGRWQSHDLHAEVGADTPVELLQHIQTLTREVGVFLATADAVVLTLGSAFAYRLRETGEIVSNCHKLPADKFDKELLTADDIIAAVAETHAYLRRINPRLQFILTVSPVRHIKDTLVLNSTSKSMLRVACHYLSELLPDVTYFPAYELLLDDLRDYRFYAADMLHPSDVAENYIWERFTRTYFDAAFGRFKKEWESLRQALGHRPLHAAAPEHRQFLESTLERLRRLSTQVDVRMELLHLERELAALPRIPDPVVPDPVDEDDDEERIDIGEFAEEGLSQAALVGHGRGVLVEPDSQNEAEDDETEPGETAEAAYEHAYSAEAAAEEPEDVLEETLEAETSGEPARRRKRRSRGGAKRTKRKHARLAAEAAAAEAPEQISVTEPTPAPTVAEVIADTATVATEPAPSAASVPEAAGNDSAEEPRRTRNNRRNRRDRPARSEGRTNRAPLYATELSSETGGTSVDNTGSEPVDAPAVPQVPSLPVAPAPEPVQPPVAEEATPSPAPARPKRPAASRSRKKSAAVPQPDTPATPVPAEPALPAAEAPAQPAPAHPAATPDVPAPKPRARRKAAPVEATVTAPAEPAAVEAVDTAVEPLSTTKPTAKKPTAPRKRAPRKAATPVAESGPETVPPPLPAAEQVPTAPKRTPRPSRRKATPDTPAPENS